MLTQTPAYKSWAAMWYRCTNKDAVGFKHYGGRGISVCPRWMSFEVFVDDMGERPPGTSLDRIDVNKDYFPDNCRWASTKVQGRNRRNLRYLTIDGVTKCLRDWEDHHSLPLGILRQRIKLGWSMERLFEKARRKTTRRGASASRMSSVGTTAIARTECP